MTIQEATYFLLNKLRAIYPESEASQMTDWVMENITGSKKAERMVYKKAEITSNEELKLQQITGRLLQHEPMQYVLQEAWFCGMKLFVDKSVLIPRPETEELVEWVLKETQERPVESQNGQAISILDAGTGSGCIPLALKRNLRDADVWSCDISKAALQVAQRNADSFGAAINLIELNFLKQDEWAQLPSFDVIVSNPPYVPESDKDQMQPNVLNYEPHTALFVPNNDPMIFYRAIAEFAKEKLNSGGRIYVEIHESLGDTATHLFGEAGYKVELRKDLQGKQRMLKAIN